MSALHTCYGTIGRYISSLLLTNVSVFMYITTSRSHSWRPVGIRLQRYGELYVYGKKECLSSRREESNARSIMRGRNNEACFAGRRRWRRVSNISRHLSPDKGERERACIIMREKERCTTHLYDRDRGINVWPFDQQLVSIHAT